MDDFSNPQGSYVSSVLGVPIDLVSWDSAVARISGWAKANESRYVCICNVHSVITARTDHTFSKVLSDADMATPDGAPLAWFMRRSGSISQERINGPDLMLRYCSHAALVGEPIFLYGGQSHTLAKLKVELVSKFPGLRIAGAYSPPFRELTADEDNCIVDMINKSGAGTVWVSLGCPKQEGWMAEHRGRINAPMIGVGAAFDYHAGVLKRAPRWMQRNGLEWLHRLCSEPRRLWKRYFITNSIFIVLTGHHFIRSRSPEGKHNATLRIDKKAVVDAVVLDKPVNSLSEGILDRVAEV